MSSDHLLNKRFKVKELPPKVRVFKEYGKDPTYKLEKNSGVKRRPDRSTAPSDTRPVLRPEPIQYDNSW